MLSLQWSLVRDREELHVGVRASFIIPIEDIYKIRSATVYRQGHNANIFAVACEPVFAITHQYSPWPQIFSATLHYGFAALGRKRMEFSELPLVILSFLGLSTATLTREKCLMTVRGF